MKPLKLIVMVMSIIVVMSYVKADENAYANNANKCLFSDWVSAGVLEREVTCAGSQLCYSASGKDPADYAVCYSTKTLIPEFTGHVVPIEKGGSGRFPFYDEEGPFKPVPASDQKEDYEIYAQKKLFPNFNDKDQFCARGHLTPNNVFPTDPEREITMINTNIAPQWQPFNAGNWAGVEAAVKKYAEEKRKQLYVVTGTAGVAKVELTPGSPEVEVILNGRVTAPKYYWKVVCDPSIKQSLVLLALNNIGDISTTQVPSDWNPGKKMTEKKGVIKTYSMEEAKTLPESSEFVWPPLGARCNPETRGKFLDEYLNRKIIS